MSKQLSLVAACCRSNGIGKDGNLPWKLKKEMEFFTRITSSSFSDVQNTGDDNPKRNAVIMGIRTYMCIPPRFRPLKGRVNVVLSRSTTQAPAGAEYLFKSLDEAIGILSSLPYIGKLYIIGGESIYRESINRPETEYIFLTRIDADFECDRFFPEVDSKLYEDLTDNTVEAPDKIEILQRFGIPLGLQQENGISYRFHLYRKRVKAQ